MGFFDSWNVKLNVHLRHAVVFPGNVVEGFVEVNNSSPIDVTAIRVEATGEEEVVASRKVSSEQRTRTVSETASTLVYNQLITLCGNMRSSGNRSSFVLPPGRYTYPFAFQLPASLPPSFARRYEDDKADIKYYVNAYVDIPNGRDAELRRHFTVLNAMPESQWATQPDSTVEKKFDVTCCCCIGKGTVRARLWMDKTLIAVDRDRVMLCADIDNTDGEKPVESVEVSLVHKMQYSAGGMTERHRKVVGRRVLEKNQIEPGEKGRIDGVIPVDRDLVPSLRTFHCESKYEILVELNIPMASDPSHSFPVILTHCVDKTNFLPPVSFDKCGYTRLGGADDGDDCRQELYYAPPPNPVVPYNPAPCPPPPGALCVSYDFSNTFGVMPNPSAGWAAPTAYQQPPPPQAQIQWQGGVDYTPMGAPGLQAAPEQQHPEGAPFGAPQPEYAAV